jgi:DNA-binding MarR family transcriptional regulator
MNAQLIHLASIDCWQRCNDQNLSFREFVVLQILASAGEAGIKSRAAARYSRLHWDTVRQYLSKLTKKGLVTGVYLARKKNQIKPCKAYSLTADGFALITPQPRAPKV